MEKSILFVDDENQILRALKRLFYHSDYTTYFVESGEVALDVMKNNHVDLLITDMRMPEMGGMELLQRVKNEYPNILRVALSSYTDSKHIYQAIEKNLAKMYLFKPWDNDEILNVVANFFKLEETLSDKTLLSVVNSLDELPTVPKLYQDMSEMIRNDENIETIGAKIEEDPAIAARILRVANSAFYGAKTGSINQAIMFIGLGNVKNIVLSNAVFSSQSKIFEMELLWKHAGLTNRLVNQLYEVVYGKKMPMINSSVGLLHTLGIVVFLTKFEDKYGSVLATRKAEADMSLEQIEDALLKCSHSKLGGFLLNWWELPYPIVEAALHYRTPLMADVMNKGITCLVHLASHTAWSILGSDVFQYPIDPQVYDYLEINERVVDNVKRRIIQQGV